MPIVELYFELGIGQRIDDCPIHLDRVVFRQRPNSKGLTTRLAVPPASWPSSAALRLKAIRAIHRFVAPWLERDARLAIAAGAGGHEHLASRCGGIATAGVAVRTEGIGALSFARRAARRAASRRIIKPATRVKLLLTTRKDERRIAIAAIERLVCVLHADSRKKKWRKLIATRTGYVGAPLGADKGSRVAPKNGSQSSCFPATRQYTRTRQEPQKGSRYCELFGMVFS
jgi:hypothetical protein